MPPPKGPFRNSALLSLTLGGLLVVNCLRGWMQSIYHPHTAKSNKLALTENSTFPLSMEDIGINVCMVLLQAKPACQEVIMKISSQFFF